MIPRYYQAEAVTKTEEGIAARRGENPLIVLPTGAGKSAVIAWMIQRAKQANPNFRCMVTAHVKELVQQNSEKMHKIWPECPIGIYSAGLNKRSIRDVTFGGIGSIKSRAEDIGPLDAVFVDEAHRVPTKGKGDYLRFLDDVRNINPNCVLIGLTATPYRMGVPSLCHEDHTFNYISYEVSTVGLINNGYLCPLKSKTGDTKLDTSSIRSNSLGDYVISSMVDASKEQGIVKNALAEAMPMLKDRKAMLFFCINEEHAYEVKNELSLYRINAPVLTQKTNKKDREEYTQGFISGKYRAILNIDILTTGFDATRTDAIVMLRPTLSKGLYVQMVGRGLRLDERKEDCLILDFADNISTHGVLSEIAPSQQKLVKCPACKEMYSASLDKCKACGQEKPKHIQPEGPGVAAERRMHNTVAHDGDIIHNQPKWHDVTDVYVFKHIGKSSGIPSLRIDYLCGISSFSEYVNLESDKAYARHIAHDWWRSRFEDEPPETVEEIIGEGGLWGPVDFQDRLKAITKRIRVIKEGRYFRVIDHEIVKEEIGVQYSTLIGG